VVVVMRRCVEKEGWLTFIVEGRRGNLKRFVGGGWLLFTPVTASIDDH
jgi:hypothetical protein